MEQKMNDIEKTTQSADAAAETLVRDLFSLGRSWASYGLTVAELGVTQSAKTMRGVAAMLRTLAVELDDQDSASSESSS
jgi:hypothetical protein